jgi:pimeloyl-ACP methyl ester carboxylesterase
MAADVAAFVHKHGLKRPTLIGHSMGAKTAMGLALREPDLIESIIAVDNAPVDVRLESDFARYIQGMKKIDEAGVTKQAEADKILEPYEKVFLFLSPLNLLSTCQHLKGSLSPFVLFLLSPMSPNHQPSTCSPPLTSPRTPIPSSHKPIQIFPLLLSLFSLLPTEKQKNNTTRKY